MCLPLMRGEDVDTGGSIGGWNPRCGDEVEQWSSFCGIIGGCQNVFPDPRNAGPFELLLAMAATLLEELPPVPEVYEVNGKSIDDLEESDVVLDDGEYPSPNEKEDTADEGGSDAESVLILLRFVDLGLISGKSTSSGVCPPTPEFKAFPAAPDIEVDVEEVMSTTPTNGLPNPKASTAEAPACA